MDTNEASRIISKAEGGDAASSFTNEGSPSASMDAAMKGGSSRSGPDPVTVSLDAGMMNGDSSGEDQRAPAGYDDHTDDVQSTTVAAPVKDDSPDNSFAYPAEKTSGVSSSSDSDISSSAQSSPDLADWFKEATMQPEAKSHQVWDSHDDEKVKTLDSGSSDEKEDGFDSSKTWTPVDSSSTTSENSLTSPSAKDSVEPEKKTETAVERMRHLFALQRKGGAYIQLFKDALDHKQQGLVSVKLHKTK